MALDRGAAWRLFIEFVLKRLLGFLYQLAGTVFDPDSGLGQVAVLFILGHGYRARYSLNFLELNRTHLSRRRANVNVNR